MFLRTATDLITNNKYTVRFAESERDIEAAQRLRFNIFNVELGEGLPDSYERGLDMDDYDHQCHHLLVISKQTDEVIGTYRMQTHDIAQKHHGFYTASEFDLSVFPPALLDASVEVGRACIERAHRNGRVLYLLWRGLANYMQHFDKRYLFGCCSLTSQSPRDAWRVMHYLEQNGHLHSEYWAATTEAFTCERPDNLRENKGSEVKLPQLFRLYMDLRARVCSPPALDTEFKTIDYLVLLDVENLDERTRMLFFK